MIKLTEQQIEKAESYVRLTQKEDFVDACMKQCLASVEVNLVPESETSVMPNMFMESTFRRSKCLMCAFVTLYLKEEVEMESEWMMTTEAYDEWAGSHIFNQLERMKDKKELRDKCFDILKDYRDLERRLVTAVRGYITILNDTTNRLYQKLYMDGSQEALEHSKQEVAKLVEEMEKLQKERE